MTARRGVLRARRFLAAATSAALLVSLLGALPAAALEPGDEPETAIPIAEIGATQAYDTSAATENPAVDPAECDGEFEHFDGPFTETFWHTFTPTESGELIVDVNSFPDPEAEGFLAILFVFSGTPADLTLVACNAFGSTVSIDAEAGTTYFAMTGSLAGLGDGGPAEITVLEPFLSNLVVAPDGTYDPQSNEVTVSGTVDCAGAEFLEVGAFGVQDIGQHQVWAEGFTFIQPCDGTVPWSVTLAGFTSFLNPGRLDVTVSVFSCTSVCVGDSVDASVTARPTSNKPPPEPPPPPVPENDEREAAIELEVDTGHFGQDVGSATANATDPADCEGQPLPSDATVWFSFTAPADDRYEVNTLFSEYDTTLFVLDGDTVIACNDDSELVGEEEPGWSLAYFDGLEGMTYTIMGGAAAGTPVGRLEIGVFLAPEPPGPVPDNDERDAAIELEVDGPSVTADTSGATVNLGTDPQGCPFAGFPPSEHTVWYAIAASADGWVEVNTFGSDFDTTLYILDGDVVVACNDDSVGVESMVVFEAVEGTVYHVMVGTFNGSPGGNLTVTALSTDEPPPPPELLELELTLNDVASVDRRTGVATLGGTIRCTTQASGFLFAWAEQTNGRFTTFGGSELEIECDEDAATWSVELPGLTSAFQPGEAFVIIEAFVGTEESNTGTFIERVVRLRAAGSRQA